MSKPVTHRVWHSTHNDRINKYVYPDFLIWQDQEVFAVDTKGGHVLPEAATRNLMRIEPAKAADNRLVVHLVSEGRWTPVCGTTPEHPFTGTFPDCLGLEEGLNPKGGLPTGPSGVPYTGGYYTSGILAVPKPHDWSLSFPNTGKFSYECTVHPGMDAFVTSG